MKFTMPKKDLVASLQRIQQIAGGRVTMPILSCVLLVATETGFTITATDMETGYTTSLIGIIWDQPFFRPVQMALPAGKLYECCKVIPIGEITFVYDFETRRATVSGGTATFVIPGHDPDEYPALPEVKGEQFDLDAPALTAILDNVAYCQCSDSNKYNLCGIFLKIEKNGEDDLFLTAVATDGHRLALDSTPLPGDPRPVPRDLEKGIIIATKAVNELRKIKSTAVMALAIAGNNLQIATDNEIVFCRLVDGLYPDVDKVIPKNFAGKIEVKRAALLEALQRVKIMSDKTSHRTSLEFGEDIINIGCETAEAGQASDRVTAQIMTEPFQMMVNADYLIESLETLDSSVVELAVSSDVAPLLITRLGTSEPLALVMPQRG